MSYRVDQGNLTLIIGPMFSGKSTELMRQLYRYKKTGSKIAVVKHTCDTRYEENIDENHNDNPRDDHSNDNTHTIEQRFLYTHEKQYLPVQFVTDSLNHIIDSLWSYDVIAIDEGHFFDDILEADRLTGSHSHIPVETNTHMPGKEKKMRHVIVSGLNGDYRQQPFWNLCRLLPCADNIMYLQAICEQCHNDASFSYHKENNKFDDTSSQICVGGGNTYEARCRPCLHDS